MEFTPSEVDALEAIRPPTPPPPPPLPELSSPPKLFASAENFKAAWSRYKQSTSAPLANGDGVHEGNTLDATPQPNREESPQRLLENATRTAPRTGQRQHTKVNGDRNNSKALRQPTTRPPRTRSIPHPTRSAA